MANLKVIRRRIKTARNISQITKAMEMVAASKMRRAQIQALASRPYAGKIYETIAYLGAKIKKENHPLLQKREIKKKAVVVISPDKGLCGGLNTNLFRSLRRLTGEEFSRIQFITVGKKARDYILRNRGTLLAEFTGFSRGLTSSDVQPIVKLLADGFREGQFDQVSLYYMHFENTLSQKPTALNLLPIVGLETPAGLKTTPADYLLEPGAEAIFEWLLPYYLEMILYQSILEALASEQSARMVAMKNATDNAADIVFELNLNYNKVRQQIITNEIAEIASVSTASAEN